MRMNTVLWNFILFLLTICPNHFYDFDLSLLKIVLKCILGELLQGKIYLLLSTLSKQND